MTEGLRLRSADGLSLEGELDRADPTRGVLVLCHPHPRMGGSMNAPLLLALRDALVGSGWSVLRFNFRGIGASEGESSTGIAEVADAAGAIAVAADRFPDAPTAIAGWSFGGAVALRAASATEDLVACATIAPAVKPKPEVTAGAPDPADYSFAGPTLVVCGANDDQVPPEDCRAWAEATGASYVEMPGANHFFWAKYEPLARAVTSFLEQALGARG